jgi:phosphoribosylaminoimidazole (AIR) synthetase
MLRTFNMGIGLIVVVPADDVGQALEMLRNAGEHTARVIGEIVAAPTPRVRYVEGGL